MASLRYDFSGETVLVTGASRGIGKAIARGFAAAGAEVFMLAADPGVDAAAKDVAAETGSACHALECDITDAEAVSTALAAIGRIDVLVNNAGLERITPLADPDPQVEATFRRIIDINVNGTFLVTRHALPKMEAGGRIIMTASIWSRFAGASIGVDLGRHRKDDLHGDPYFSGRLPAGRARPARPPYDVAKVRIPRAAA